MSLQDGVRGILPLVDVIRRSDERDVSLAAGAQEQFLVETGPGEVWALLDIGFFVSGIAGSTGSHTLLAWALHTSLPNPVLLRLFTVTAPSTAALNFCNYPNMAPGEISELRPRSDEACIAMIRGTIMGRELGINNQLWVRYTNNSNLAQTGRRRYLMHAKRMVDVP